MSDNKLNDEAGRLACLSRLAILEAKDGAGFAHITQVVRTALDLPIAAVTLIGAEDQYIKASIGLGLERTSRSSSFCTITIQERGALIVEDALQHPPFDANEYVLGDPFIRSYVGVPLVTMEGYQVGSLCGMDHRPRTFSPAQISLMDQLARCVENEMELKMSAALDGLTRLLSRTAFFDVVESARARAGGAGPCGSVAIVDLDHFKSINDTYGHQTGDDVLRAASRLFAETFGTAVHVGRLGGEEFGILLPGRTADEAAAMLERYRAALEVQRIGAGKGIRVTASLGIAELMPTGLEADATAAFKRADVALYRSKSGGRNRITIWEDRGEAVPEQALALPSLRRVRARDGEIDARSAPEQILKTLSRRPTKPVKVRRQRSGPRQLA
ncbi:sensor domain-containing diguanylate cyclase [Acuticoccus sediminis]|uniref:sensor domain-containing diguanylate cyclase n=1 Tax=Acuticoccus sediminis TaxID=2184697 RepID=UPI0011B93937|nr:sensor domain-containing diguanylate cyclase [Acuticoccus sediminis]